MSLKTPFHRVVNFRTSIGERTRCVRPFTSSSLLTSEDNSSQTSKEESNKASGETPSGPKNEPASSNKIKSVSQADKELRERLEQMSGEGGAAGIEYEDGKPNAMKRGVRNNMFRLI